MAWNLRVVGCRSAIALGTLFYGLVSLGADGASIFDDNYKVPPPKNAIAPASGPVVRAPGSDSPPTVTPPLIPASASPGSESTGAGEYPAGKLPAPDAATKKQTLKLVKQIFDAEYSQKTPLGKKTLAVTLLTEANKIRSNFPARFVLLQESETAAVAAGDAEVCRKAIDGLDDTFIVDISAMTTEALAKLSETGASEGALAMWAAEAIQRQIDQNNYQSARHIVKMIAPRLSKSNDATSLSTIKCFETVIAEYDRARPAIEKLNANPNDPAANFVAGKFFCFYKRDWARGLPMLAKGTDQKLRNIAQKDMANPSDVGARYDLAGQWWDLGHERMHAPIESQLHERANYWYEKASPDLTGLQKVMAEKRLAELPGEGARVNILSRMNSEGSRVTTTNGIVRMNKGGVIRTPAEVTVPLRIDVVAMTDSTNIRIGYAGGRIILNWEGNPNELRHHSPVDDAGTAFPAKGHVPVNQWAQVTWIIEDGISRVLVDGEERGSVKGNYSGVHGTVSVYPAGSIVSVKSVSVTQLKSRPADR